MNEELLTPGVPTLSDEWVRERTQHLVEEIATPSRRKKQRYVLGGVGGGVLAVAATLVGLLGPWASPAFAGWSSQPTSAASGQVSTAETACASLAANLASEPGSTASATLPPVSLTTPGTVHVDVYGITNPSLCLLGNGFSSLNEDGGTFASDAASMGGGTPSSGDPPRAASRRNSGRRHPPLPGKRRSNSRTPPSTATVGPSALSRARLVGRSRS